MKTILKGIAESADEDVDSALAASRFYQAGLSFLQFDRSMAYVSLVSAVECLAGRYFRTQTLSFDEVKHQFQEFDPLFQDLSTMPSASDQLKQLLIKNVYRLRQRFVSFIEKHLPEEFWVISDSDYDDSARQLVPKIGRQELQGRLKDAYDARSRYVHAGEPLPAYVEIGTAEGVSLAAFSQLGELGVLPEGEHYAPTLMWLERVVNLVLLEYIRRTFATELQIRIEKQLRKHRTLLERITKLPQEAQNSLVKLTKWTTRWLGFAVIGPHLPNKDWADNPQSVRALREAGLIAVNGSDADGSSGLRDRRVGEAAGEFVFGPADNPLRDSELLMPEGFEATDSTE